ncbi:MAG: GNAT family N-acetyltransferase [Acidobacteriota bacterium]|nr:GNAT family N-acetyltransferase [Acidobacteriota bacterium]
MPVTVRRALRGDGARIVELDRELATFEKLRPPDDGEAARLLSWIFDTSKLEALVAELDGTVEGIALFYETPGSTFRARPFLYLEDLVVSEAARSKGVGEALLAALAQEALARNAWRLQWAVLDWNVRAIKFYDRLGAKKDDWLHYGLDEEGIQKLAGG